MDDRSPISRGRELASQLRGLRESAGLSVADVARQARLSPFRIGGIETVSPAASPDEVRGLGAVYGVDDQRLTQLLALAQEARHKGWWDEYEDLGISRLIKLESEASQISSYEPSVIPWMFQTEQYARAVIKGIRPDIKDDVLKQRVEARLRRQELLTRESWPSFRSFVDEAALHRPVGGPHVMRDQLRKMVEVATSDSGVTLRVVPLSLGAHPGLDSAFTLVEFDSPRPAVVYLESLADALYLDRPFEVGNYRHALTHLHAEALSPESSVQFITHLQAGEFASFSVAAHPGIS